MRLREATVAISGLGLMGGSLALALRGKCQTLVGIARRPELCEQATREGVVDRATCDLTLAAAHADIVVLATPVLHIVECIPHVVLAMRPGALLIDLGSTKRDIVAAMNGIPEGVLAVAGHPMCGKETGGLESADPAMFKGARFVLTPTERTTDEALVLAFELVEAVGACPLVLDAERHDRAVAVISHLPYLLASSLVHAEEEAGEDSVVSALAASGFRDTTRLAASQVEMMLQVLQTNREAIESALDLFERNIAKARDLLNNPTALELWMEQARDRRRGMFK
jgi:prephenate dehydrogenase